MHQHVLEQSDMEHLEYHILAFLGTALHTDHQAYQDYQLVYNLDPGDLLQIQ